MFELTWFGGDAIAYGLDGRLSGRLECFNVRALQPRGGFFMWCHGRGGRDSVECVNGGCFGGEGHSSSFVSVGGRKERQGNWLPVMMLLMLFHC